MRSACSSLDRCVPRAAHVSGISVLADVLRVLVAARRPTVIVLTHPFGSCVTRLKISFQRPSQALSCGDALADGPRDADNFYGLRAEPLDWHRRWGLGMRSRHMNHVLPATGLRAVIVRLRATKPQKFGFLRHCASVGWNTRD